MPNPAAIFVQGVDDLLPSNRICFSDEIMLFYLGHIVNGQAAIKI
jgi:hypothetical protein